MPEPITAPMPSAMRLHTPSVLRRHLSGSSEAAISASMLLVRRSGEATMRARGLSLALALGHLLDLLLVGSARYSRGALGLRRRLLARRALQLLAFSPLANLFGIHSSWIPENF